MSTFVKKDISILKSKYSVEIFHFQVYPKKKIFLQFFRQFFFLFKHINKKSIIVIQFGGFHAVLPVIFSKIFKSKSIIVLGGTDCVSFPSLNYGNFNRFFLGKATSFGLKNADLLLPVDESLVYYKYVYTNEDFQFQGYMAHDKKIKTNYQVVYNGYDCKKWNVCNIKKQKNTFVTIGANFNSRFGQKLKGLDLILDLANKLQEDMFFIVGGKSLKIDAPSNVILMDNIENEKLPEFLGEMQYYLQLSLSEGFPNALCEAMLCNCIPIVSNVGAMPKIVDDERLVLPEKNLTLLLDLISKVKAIDFDPIIFRDRICNNYSISKRKTDFLSVIENFNL